LSQRKRARFQGSLQAISGVPQPTPFETAPHISFDRLFSDDCRISSGRPFGTTLRRSGGLPEAETLIGESLARGEKRSSRNAFGKFEFTEHAFGADKTRDSPPSPNIGGGITLHPVAALCCGRGGLTLYRMAELTTFSILT
jgi:hypothetical protein